MSCQAEKPKYFVRNKNEPVLKENAQLYVKVYRFGATTERNDNFGAEQKKSIFFGNVKRK